MPFMNDCICRYEIILKSLHENKILDQLNAEQLTGKIPSVEDEADLALLKEIKQDRIELQKRIKELERMKASPVLYASSHL